jgi:hypothetical protein
VEEGPAVAGVAVGEAEAAAVVVEAEEGAEAAVAAAGAAAAGRSGLARQTRFAGRVRRLGTRRPGPWLEARAR